MPFNIALTGIRAASDDLKITGNNISNASTTGFKSSRAEFGDVYAASILGAGTNNIGTGVRLQNVAQQFTQGSINFTQNVLDLAISGAGFFILDQSGETLYTRAGALGIDDEGFIVSNNGARLQGFPADADGNITGLLNDLQVQAGSLPPQQTTGVESDLNLDSQSIPPARQGSQFTTSGTSVGVAQSGQLIPTSTVLDTLGNQTVGYDFTAPNNASFDITLSGATSASENGTISISLAGPTSSVADIATQINNQINAATNPIGVTAIAVDQGGGVFRLEFQANTPGDASTIAVSSLGGTAAAGAPLFLNVGASTAGIPALTNGYPVQSVDFTDPTGGVTTYTTSAAGQSAATTASELNAIAGVTATATTSARITAGGYNNTGGNMVLTINNVPLTSDTLAALETEINAASIPGVTATLTGGDLVLTSATGEDIFFNISSTDAADQVTIVGTSGTTPVTIDAGAGDQDAVVGGTVTILMDQGYSASNPSPIGTGLFSAFTAATFQNVVIGAFDPQDQSTYNHATSLTIYDSLGNSHVMTQYFVKENYDPNDPSTYQNDWTMYVLIDGENVGDPNPGLPPPGNTLPTRASYTVRFNSDGTLNPLLSDPVLISNWTPLDANGVPNGATGPQNVLAGGVLPIPDPPTSSNFGIDISDFTQFGSPFAVNNVNQDGYTTGRMASLSIDTDGILFARFTNGETQVLGQVALARFNNEQGLNPSGDTTWAETSESGQPNIGAPNTSALGALQSSSLEDSNVDLSAQLVQLIIAQRNFQANAKTIETANQTTQTIINLR